MVVRTHEYPVWDQAGIVTFSTVGDPNPITSAIRHQGVLKDHEKIAQQYQKQTCEPLSQLHFTFFQLDSTDIPDILEMASLKTLQAPRVL